MSASIRKSMKPLSPVINKYSTATGFSIFTMIVSVIISLFILEWLNKIAKCKCSNRPEGMYLREWWVFLVIWQIFAIFLYIIYEADINQYPVFINILSVIIVFITIAMIIRLFMYIRKLRELNCDCGLSPEENIIYYYLLIVFGFIVFIVLGIILMFMFNIE
jgi:hypothetical protein